MKPRNVSIPLPRFDPEGKCPSCDRPWAFDRRCRGYVLTACDRYPPHVHRKCTCSREVIEMDPDAVEGRDFVFAPRTDEEVRAAHGLARVCAADCSRSGHSGLTLRAEAGPATVDETGPEAFVGTRRPRLGSRYAHAVVVRNRASA